MVERKKGLKQYFVRLWLSLINSDQQPETIEDEQYEHLLVEISNLSRATVAITNGEVGAKLPNNLPIELENIAVSFNKIIDTSSVVIKDIDEMSESSAKTSRELEDITTNTSRVMTDLSATLEELTSTTLQLNSSVSDISEGADEISALTTDGMTHLTELENKMESIQSKSNTAKATISSLNDAASEMDSILSVISGISKQTNLLALNAAIEAARAGESGKGFAVVADEVRKLASLTQESLEDIKVLIDRFNLETDVAVEQINSNNTEVDQGNTLLHETTNTFRVISDRITAMVQQVKESSMGTQQIAGSSQEIASAAAVQSESIGSIHELAMDLAQKSTDMKDALADVQIGSTELELDLEEFDRSYSRITEQEQEAMRKEFGVKGKFVVGMIARLVPNKGHAFFLEALKNVIRNHPNAVVIVAGNGALDHELERQVKQMGLEDQVLMVGYRSDVQTILSICDMIVATSIKEGTPPRIILEAMAAEKPLISTDVAGAKAILKHTEHGLLVKHGDVSNLSEMLTKLITKPEIGRNFAKQARAHIENLYYSKTVG